jgi:hypothetical protein
MTDVADDPDDDFDEANIRLELGSQLKKLWTGVPKIQQEVMAVLKSTGQSTLLDIKAMREDRVRSTVCVLVQAEAFAASKGLDPIAKDFLAKDNIAEVVAAIIRTGLFGGKTTIAGLDQLRQDEHRHAFSAKELYVVAGFLGEEYEMPAGIVTV